MDRFHHRIGLSVLCGPSIWKSPTRAIFSILVLAERAEVFCLTEGVENCDGVSALRFMIHRA